MLYNETRNIPMAKINYFLWRFIMNKRIKVLVSAVLATVMLVLCIPFTAAAAGTTSLEVGKGYTISAANANGTLYVTGTVTSGRFDGTYNADEAAVFYVEAAASAGEYLLYFMNGTTKTYIVMGDSTTGGSTTTDATSATVFEWNTEKNTLAVADDSNNRAFGAGATSTYANFSAYDLSGSYNWGAFIAVDADNDDDEGGEDVTPPAGDDGDDDTQGGGTTPSPDTNDSVVAYIAVAVVALFGIAYVSKKKH